MSKQDRVTDGALGEIGKRAGGVAFVAVGFVLVVGALIAFRGPIGEIFTATDKIEKASIFVGEQEEINKFLSDSVLKLQTQMEGQSDLEAVHKKTSAELTRLSNNFSAVEKSSTSSYEKVNSLGQEFGEFRSKNVEFEKELSQVRSDLNQATEKIVLNSVFTAEQPKRAAGRIKDIAFNNYLATENKVLIEKLVKKIDQLKNDMARLKSKHDAAYAQHKDQP